MVRLVRYCRADYEVHAENEAAASPRAKLRREKFVGEVPCGRRSKAAASALTNSKKRDTDLARSRSTCGQIY